MVDSCRAPMPHDVCLAPAGLSFAIRYTLDSLALVATLRGLMNSGPGLMSALGQQRT